MRVERFDSLEAARATWEALEADCDGYPFQHYSWQAHYADCIGDGLGFEPAVVLVRGDDGEPWMLLPLGLWRKGVRRLVWLGYDLCDYHAPLLAPDCPEFSAEEMAALWEKVIAEVGDCDVVNFFRQPERIGARANPMLLLTGTTPHDNAHAATLDLPYPEWYQQRVSKKIRQDSNRQRRRLGELGELRFKIASDNIETHRFVEAMMDYKEQQYRETDARNALARESHRRFYTEGCSLECVQISALLLDDRILAVHWGVVSPDRYLYLMPAYDVEWAKYSPGRLLLEELMQWSREQGIAVFDFTVGSESYKMDWCDQHAPIYETWQPCTLAGRLYLTAREGGQKVKVLREAADTLNRKRY